MMTLTLWILKGLVGALFLFLGINKMFLTKSRLLDKGMKGLVNLEEQHIKIAGLLEFLGAVGLILPSLLRIYPWLAGLAALGLGMTMIVAAVINYKLKLPVLPNLLILAMCMFIAYMELS